MLALVLFLLGCNLSIVHIALFQNSIPCLGFLRESMNYYRYACIKSSMCSECSEPIHINQFKIPGKFSILCLSVDLGSCYLLSISSPKR